MDRSPSFRLQAEMIVVSASQFLTPGQIVLRAGRIAEVCGNTHRPADVDLEGVALLPGLVNPHTHLEFSDMATPLPSGKDFPDWIRLVLEQRRSRGPHSDQALIAAIAAGLCESRSRGVAALVDVVSPPWTPDNHLMQAAARLAGDRAERWAVLPEDIRALLSLELWQRMQSVLPPAVAMPSVIACIEQLGLTADRIAAAVAWRDEIESTKPSAWPACLRGIGWSPHAPYSTDQSCVQDVADLAARQRRLIAMHMAESLAERQWVDSGSGPFLEMFTQLGVTGPPRSKSLIVEACHAIARAPHALLVHGNYLNQAEMDAVAAHRDNLSVVYCPRTHRHFQHAPYPLAALQSRGIRVVLGTDSRSTNPDLNLWQEGRAALLAHSGLRPSQVLAAITEQAAMAVGWADEYGTLRRGRIAALGAIRLERAAHTNQRSDVEDILGGWFENVPHPTPLL